MTTFFDAFKSRRVFLLIPLGFASGLPLFLSGSTLTAWMQLEGVDLKTIGIFAAVALPYNFKFVWAPLLDRFRMPWLSRRRDWMILTQLLLMAVLAVMGSVDPVSAPWAMAGLAVGVAFLSASQDIVADAYRTDVLPDHELGSGTATFVMGYRIALLAAGAGALILTEYLTWQGIYLCMAGLMLIGVIATVLAPDPEQTIRAPRTLADAVIKPFVDFITRSGALWALGVVMLYKFGDAVAGHLITPFLLDLHVVIGLDGGHFSVETAHHTVHLLSAERFSPAQVGYINKGFGLGATIVGALVGGGMVSKLGVRGALLLFGFLQAGANVGYMALAVVGKNIALLWAAIGIDQFFGGLGTAAFVAFLMALCNKRFSAFQYALLSSASSLVGRVLGTGSGFMVDAMGWAPFFAMTIIAAVPALVLIFMLPTEIGRPLSEPASQDAD